MSKFKKIISMLLGVVLSFTVALSMTGCNNSSNNDDTITVTDMLGEKVTVKKNPKKVACASRTTYDLLIAFGVADSIDGVYYSLLNNEWRRYLMRNQVKDTAWRIKKVMKLTLLVG